VDTYVLNLAFKNINTILPNFQTSSSVESSEDELQIDSNDDKESKSFSLYLENLFENSILSDSNVANVSNIGLDDSDLISEPLVNIFDSFCK